MGKKKKKKSKGPQPILADVEREMFQTHINEIRETLDKITAKCKELEKINEDYEDNYKKLDVDRGDVITYLKRTLAEKTEEAKQLQDIVDQLNAERGEQEEKFAAKMKQMEHEFKMMQEQLNGDIQLITGRLKALEHFRVQQDELMNKFKQQEIHIEERAREHKRTLYEVEKKFIIAKDKAMKDMEVRQLQLSSEFEATRQMCIAGSAKKAIRENIAVNDELLKVQETTYRLIKENERLKELDRYFKIQKELVEEEKNIVIQENTEHIQVINHLTQQYEEASEQMGRLSYAASRLPEVELKLQRLQSTIAASQQQFQALTEELHNAQYSQEGLQHQVLEAQTGATTLEAVLDTAATEIQNAIMHTTVADRSMMSDEEKQYALEERDNLLTTLLDLIRGNLIQFSKLTPKKTLKTVACSALYTPGSLGLISRSSSRSATEDNITKKAESYDQDFESLPVVYDSSKKVSLEGQRSSTSEAAVISEKQEESSKAAIVENTEVEPIERKGSSVIRESSIIVNTSSILQDLSSAMVTDTESGEVPSDTELGEVAPVSSQTSSLSKKSSLRVRSSADRSFTSQEKSKVRFQDKKTDSQQLKSPEG